MVVVGGGEDELFHLANYLFRLSHVGKEKLLDTPPASRAYRDSDCGLARTRPLPPPHLPLPFLPPPHQLTVSFI